MKTKISLLSLILFYGINMMLAQTTVFRFSQGKKEWGYINNNNNIVIQLKKPICYSISDNGLLLVEYTKKNLFVFYKLDDSVLETEVSGKDFIMPIIKPEIKSLNATNFRYKGYANGVAAIKRKEKMGVLNSQGKLIIPIEYSVIEPFREGHALALKEGKLYVLDVNGNSIETKVKDVKAVRLFVEGGAPFKTLKGGMGMVNTKGEVIVPAKYKKVAYYNNGKARVWDFEGKLGEVNKQGEETIKPQFKTMGKFVNGVAWARKRDENVGFINETGEWVIEPKFLAAKDFDEKSGICKVKAVDGWKFINIKEEAVSFEGDFPTQKYNEGLCIGRKGEKIGYYNETGKWAIEPKFERAKKIREGRALAMVNGKWGMINTKGEWLIEPQYIKLRNFVNGYACFQKDKLWGAIDEKGNVVVEPQFRYLNDAVVVNK